LVGNYPNPVNPTTTIDFTLKSSGAVKLAVYNTAVQQIRALAAEEMSAGHHSVVWDDCDSFGNAVSSGINFTA